MAKNWKEYEWGVIQIIEAEIGEHILRHNVRLVGRSGRKRQIDLLAFKSEIDHSEFDIYDCKKRNKPVDIKEIEQFIGLVSDTRSREGIMISSCGFTHGAYARAKIEKNLRLRRITWNEAFDAAAKEPIPNTIAEVCNNCIDNHRDSELTGKILWYGVWAKQFEINLSSIFWVGKCLKCEHAILFCNVCGGNYSMKDSRMICPRCHLYYISFRKASDTDEKPSRIKYIPHIRRIKHNKNMSLSKFF